MQDFYFSHRVPRTDLALGVLVARSVRGDAAPSAPLSALYDSLSIPAQALERAGQRAASEREAAREASRAALRNGSYKPTGRGKPASEYLQRAADEGRFPRVNVLVDAANLISLKYLIPISLWDVDLANARNFEFCLGASGESYVFNAAGQSLELADLVTGYALDGGAARPIVSPVKDSLATKLTSSTRNVAACIYYPLAAGGAGSAEAVTRELLDLLRPSGSGAEGVSAVCMPGQAIALSTNDHAAKGPGSAARPPPACG